MPQLSKRQNPSGGDVIPVWVIVVLCIGVIGGVGALFTWMRLRQKKKQALEQELEASKSEPPPAYHNNTDPTYYESATMGDMFANMMRRPARTAQPAGQREGQSYEMASDLSRSGQGANDASAASAANEPPAYKSPKIEPQRKDVTDGQ
ncbi:Hypothetical protein D9617_60g048180 [Elsinoe fawcettii]|nr:Hypothetical protein D9617_60g048180 [Elsinoe fawcettii]